MNITNDIRRNILKHKTRLPVTIVYKVLKVDHVAKTVKMHKVRTADNPTITLSWSQIYIRTCVARGVHEIIYKHFITKYTAKKNTTT